MKSSIVQPFMKRPFWPVVMSIFILSLSGIFLISGSMLVARSRLDRVAIVLIKLGFKHIPPFLWISAILIAVLWLLVMARVWRQ